MIADRQTNAERERETDRQTRSSQYSVLPIGGGVANKQQHGRIFALAECVIVMR